MSEFLMKEKPKSNRYSKSFKRISLTTFCFHEIPLYFINSDVPETAEVNLERARCEMEKK